MTGQEKKKHDGFLAVDVGNTTIRFGLFLNDDLTATWEIATRSRITADEARLSIDDFLAMLERGRIGDEAVHVQPTDSIVSSVVPDQTDVWISALNAVCGRKPFVVGPGLKTGIKMRYNDPSEIGSDRVADLVAAKEIYGYPLVVVDFGTTTTIEVLDREGAFAGGMIAPGLTLSSKVLAQAAARLPIVDLRAPATVVGKSTREAMQAGVVFGEVARVDGLIDMIWNELGYETDVVATGGDAGVIAALSKRIHQVDGALILKGLGILYRTNSSR